MQDATIRDTDLSGLQVRGSLLRSSRWRGVVLIDVDIHGELVDVRVNGLEIGPMVEAELDRRMPDRVRMRPDDAEGFRAAYWILERRWADTVARARALPEPMLHESVDEEWSFVQTLRHLGFASAAWVGRMVLGEPAPGIRLTCRGTRRRSGTTSPTPATCGRPSRRFSSCGPTGRRWCGRRWPHSPTISSPQRSPATTPAGRS